MKKANIQKLEILAADWLQQSYKHYLFVKSCTAPQAPERDEAFNTYDAQIQMLQGLGCYWSRRYTGDDSETGKLDIGNYSHYVKFPEDREVERMNVDSYK